MIVYLCVSCFYFFFFKQKTAYEMRISDWSSDVCSSDLGADWPCSQLAHEMTGHNCVGVIRNAGQEVALGASGTAFARGGTAVFAPGFYLGGDFSGGDRKGTRLTSCPLCEPRMPVSPIKKQGRITRVTSTQQGSTGLS